MLLKDGVGYVASLTARAVRDEEKEKKRDYETDGSADHEYFVRPFDLKHKTLQYTSLRLMLVVAACLCDVNGLFADARASASFIRLRLENKIGLEQTQSDDSHKNANALGVK